ncbi:hypothetical protein Q0N12_19475 [Rossellomorea marisflavi]|uniref:DUF6994 family protein n=1 Tax=Rossellomorea marisflavi TaxID=189381 RepID=UPI00345B11BF
MKKHDGDLKACRELLLTFLDEKWKGDTQPLSTFDFSSLKGNKKYGCRGRKFDCDDTDLARAIYYLVWGDLLPYLTLDTLKRKWYRGDTLNSFHTMFGKEVTSDGSQKRFWGVEKYFPDLALKKSVERFHQTYHTIGNFVPLPNKKLGSQTFNTYRGVKYGDYFDLFLKRLEHWFLNEEGLDDDKVESLIQENSFYLDRFERNKDGFKSFCEVNYFTDYLTEEWNVNHGVIAHSRWWHGNLTKETYSVEAYTYMEYSSAIIESRANKIIEKLDIRLKDSY